MNKSEAAISAFYVVQEHLVRVTGELFEAYGVSLKQDGQSTTELVPYPSDERLVMAVIGYAGETLRGAIVLLTATDKVERWQTAGWEGGASIEAIHDTVGEFSNMLLGRLKNSLINLGVSFLLTTPATASGTGLKIPIPHGGFSAWHRFEGTAGRLDVRLDAAFDTTFSFGPRKSKEPPASAGDMVFF
jgi:CheY-specific phosphatase CheX